MGQEGMVESHKSSWAEAECQLWKQQGLWGLGSESVVRLVTLVLVTEECGEEEQYEGRWTKGVRSLCGKWMKLLFMERQREQTEKEVEEVRTDIGGGKR